MDIVQLRQICCDRLAEGGKTIMLITESTRLLKTRGPIGELLCVNSKNQKVVLFDVNKILDFLDKEEKKERKRGI